MNFFPKKKKILNIDLYKSVNDVLPSSLIVPLDDSTMCKPTFSKALKNLQIRDGETLTLECSVSGDPEPQISWSKNGKTISSSEIMDLKYKNGVAKLTINEIFPEDEGLYVCTATNSVGSTDTQCKLTIIREYEYVNR